MFMKEKCKCFDFVVVVLWVVFFVIKFVDVLIDLFSKVVNYCFVYV